MRSGWLQFFLICIHRCLSFPLLNPTTLFTFNPSSSRVCHPIKKHSNKHDILRSVICPVSLHWFVSDRVSYVHTRWFLVWLEAPDRRQLWDDEERRDVECCATWIPHDLSVLLPPVPKSRKGWNWRGAVADLLAVFFSDGWEIEPLFEGFELGEDISQDEIENAPQFTQGILQWRTCSRQLRI